MFSSHSVEEHTDSIAAHLPSGKAWLWKAKQSNGRDFLRGLGYELLRDESLLIQFWEQLDPRYTTYFIEEWESALGIPDTCFNPIGKTIEQRRLYVVVKLASLGVQTAQDFVNLAAIFGITCTVEAGGYYGAFPLHFPVLVFGTAEDARFTIIVNFQTPVGSGFPWSFPHYFLSGINDFIMCIFEHLKPANCNIISRSI
jgi:uncharacterized protein YmfQ (DUF2313 family)